ncbi:MAG: serpin family protein [Streptosporangiaceae bacterium]|jgi:serpin B
MRNSLRVFAGVTAAALLAAGCGSATAPGPEASQPIVSRGVAIREPAADPRPYGAADTAFGLAVLGAWCRADPQANVVFSPASLATGLGLAYLGARGGTAQAMAAVLHLPVAGGQPLEAGLQARSAALRGLDSAGVTLADSDQVWADPSLVTLRSYLNAVATGYGAGVARVPLLKQPEQARGEINSAVAAATRGQIPQLLPPGSLDGAGWVLTDALYLHAAWATPFDVRQTGPGPFTTAAGRRVSARFMKGGEFSVAQAAGWTAVRIPYRGGKLAMEALLPDTAGAGCPALSAATLGTISAGLAAAGQAPGAGSGTGGGSGAGGSGSGMTDIALPKVSLSSSIRMNGLLSGLGMGVAFGGSADFTGLSPQACCIGFVQHAATLRVAEEGTVASAATAVGVLPSAVRAPVAEIDFDRPYLLLVTDTGTGEPLFMARVANPLTG